MMMSAKIIKLSDVLATAVLLQWITELYALDGDVAY